MNSKQVKHQTMETQSLASVTLLEGTSWWSKHRGRVPFIHSVWLLLILDPPVWVLVSKPKEIIISLSKHLNKLFRNQPWAHIKTPGGNFEITFVWDKKEIKKNHATEWIKSLGASHLNSQEEFFFFSQTSKSITFSPSELKQNVAF